MLNVKHKNKSIGYYYKWYYYKWYYYYKSIKEMYIFDIFNDFIQLPIT